MITNKHREEVLEEIEDMIEAQRADFRSRLLNHEVSGMSLPFYLDRAGLDLIREYKKLFKKEI